MVMSHEKCVGSGISESVISLNSQRLYVACSSVHISLGLRCSCRQFEFCTTEEVGTVGCRKLFFFFEILKNEKIKKI
jgi:hypothetical protein